MKISFFLQHFTELPLSFAEPEGRQVVEKINMHSATKYHQSTLTAKEAAQVIDTLSQDAQEDILNYELNDGLNLVTLRGDLQKIVDSGSGSTMRLVMSAFMGLLVFCTSAGFTWMVVKVGLATKTFPDWTVMALPFLIPGMILWHIFGVLTKERKDTILMAMGKSPAIQSTMGGLASRLTGAMTRNERPSSRP